VVGSKGDVSAYLPFWGVLRGGSGVNIRDHQESSNGECEVKLENPEPFLLLSTQGPICRHEGFKVRSKFEEGRVQTHSALVQMKFRLPRKLLAALPSYHHSLILIRTP